MSVDSPADKGIMKISTSSRYRRRNMTLWLVGCSWTTWTILALHGVTKLPMIAGRQNNFMFQANPVSVGIRSAVRRSRSSNPLWIGTAAEKSSSSGGRRSRVITEPLGEDVETRMCGFGTTRQRSSKSSISAVTSTAPPKTRKSAGNTAKDETSAGIKQITNGGEGERNTKTNNNISATTTTTRSKSTSKSKDKKDTNELVFWENMVCGAISRSVAQTVMHPANTMKTIMQAERVAGGTPSSFASLIHPSQIKTLARGAGAQFFLSVPHGAINFAVLEYVRRQLNRFVQEQPASGKQQTGVAASRGGSAVAAMGARRFSLAAGPTLDFMSSAISTICCSVVSTPQMMVTDNIMAGRFENLPQAVNGLMKESGIMGFYSGWWPGLAGKIPSYALTWTLFQQLKTARLKLTKRPAHDIENSIMGCIASGATVCLMIPMDTIKTRLVTQGQYANMVPYKGITDAAVRIAREEGVAAFYRGLTPRLLSVMPMIGIQFGVYEYMKKAMLVRKGKRKTNEGDLQQNQNHDTTTVLPKVAMEVAADDDQPFPVPHLHRGGSSGKVGKRLKLGRMFKLGKC